MGSDHFLSVGLHHLFDVLEDAELELLGFLEFLLVGAVGDREAHVGFGEFAVEELGELLFGEKRFPERRVVDVEGDFEWVGFGLDVDEYVGHRDDAAYFMKGADMFAGFFVQIVTICCSGVPELKLFGSK